MENTCVCCGKEIPEGCNVCYECEHAPNLQVRSCADCANKIDCTKYEDCRYEYSGGNT